MRQMTFDCQPSFEEYVRVSRREQFLLTMETCLLRLRSGSPRADDPLETRRNWSRDKAFLKPLQSIQSRASYATILS